MGEDPIKFNGQDFNFYRYVGNLPNNLIDSSGFSPDKDKVYHCSSSSFSESFHAFNCAGGKCSGNYPAWNFQDWTTKPWFNGEIRDDTEDFDNPNYDCKEEKPRGDECNWNVYRQCMINFVNSNKSFGYDITYRQCRSWAWWTEKSCREVSNCE